MFLELSYRSINRKKLYVVVYANTYDNSFEFHEFRINGKSVNLDKVSQSSHDRMYSLVNHLFNLRKEIESARAEDELQIGIDSLELNY